MPPDVRLIQQEELDHFARGLIPFSDNKQLNLDKNTYVQHLKLREEKQYPLPGAIIPYVDKFINSVSYNFQSIITTRYLTMHS